MRYIVLLFFSFFISVQSFAAPSDDCISYKLTPSVNIITPTWTKQVVQPLQPMNLLHGNVTATFVDNYDIVADITSIEDGFCVGLKSVNASVGYSDFLVQIDIRHNIDSCSYNAILSHEDEHIRAYLSVIDDFKSELKNSVFNAADSIMPIFVSNQSDIENAIDELNNQMQSHADLILVKQKIKAAEEIRNKHVDINDDGNRLKQCIK